MLPSPISYPIVCYQMGAFEELQTEKIKEIKYTDIEDYIIVEPKILRIKYIMWVK